MFKNKVRDYLVPSQLEAVLYFVLTIAILFVANLNYLTTYWLHNTGNVPLTEEGALRLYSSWIFGFIEDLAFVPSTAVFVFWSLVGLAIFSLGQSIYNVYAEVKDDINLDTHFLHPSNYTRRRFWEEVAVQFTAHILLYGLIVLWGLLMGFVLIPLSSVFGQRLIMDPGFANVATFVSSLALLYVGVLILAILLKLFFKRKQLMI